MSGLQETLFNLPTPKSDFTEIARATEGPKYAGSKLKLIPQILRLVSSLEVSKVWDAFSGSTRVSQAFARAGYSVESNDISYCSETFARAFLCNEKDPSLYRDLIDHLNAVKPCDGWFTKTYGGVDFDGSAVQPDGKKKLWQVHNTRKLDGIRQEIDRLNLDPVTHSVALASLILALDAVDSSLGHFTSYLRNWSPRSYNSLHLHVPNLLMSNGKHSVTRRDALESCNPLSHNVDLAYFDPPYGSNNEKMPPSRVRYESYYHIWKTIVLNDHPETFGAANRRLDSRDVVSVSPFEEFKRDINTGKFIAVSAIEKLISSVDVPFVLLSYSNGGRATKNELWEVLQDSGELLAFLSLGHRGNVMGGMTWTNQWVKDDPTDNEEYLFLLRQK